MQVKVSLKFLKKSVDEKTNFGDDRVADMSGKPEFADMPDHGIDLARVTAASSNLRAGILAAQGGNRSQKDALVPLVNSWNREMKKVAVYVTEKASEKNSEDEQVAIVNTSGFDYYKIVRTKAEVPGQVTDFSMAPVANVSKRAKIKSDTLGRYVNYVSIFHTEYDYLDRIYFKGNQFTLPPSDKPCVIHFTSNPRETEVELTSGIKWHGFRFGINTRGKGANSNRASVIPQ
jgi:hypothetical protein